MPAMEKGARAFDMGLSTLRLACSMKAATSWWADKTSWQLLILCPVVNSGAPGTHRPAAAFCERLRPLPRVPHRCISVMEEWLQLLLAAYKSRKLPAA